LRAITPKVVKFLPGSIIINSVKYEFSLEESFSPDPTALQLCQKALTNKAKLKLK
jgi:hypothetical protein